MTTSRRKTLAILGGGFIAAATAGTGYAVTRLPQTAAAPWAAAGTYSDPRMRALSYAILAPNPHNRQPWLVDLDAADEVTLYVDQDRLLPHTDPFSRQIVVGLGCFLELMTLAAAMDGYAVDLSVFPEGGEAQRLDARPIAVARFRQTEVAAERDLFDQIPFRRSLKEPYDLTRPVADPVLSTLEAAVVRGSGVQSTNDTGAVQVLRDLTVRAFEIEFETHRTYKESVDLFRIGHREVDANPDGLDFTGPMFEALSMTGLFSRDAAMDRDSISYQSGIDMVTGNARTGMAYIWTTTEGNSRADQIVAGRDWVRLNLAATALGVGVQPMSQGPQEFPEMAGIYDDLHAMLAPGGGTVQMLGRLGYGPDVGQSPRWPLEAKLIG